MPRLLIVSNDGAVRWVFTIISGVALGPAAIALDTLLHGTARDERCCARQRRRRQRPKRADVVNHPNAAAMCRKHQVVFALLQCDVPHGEPVREIVRLELSPRLAAVQRHEQAELGTEIKDVRIDRVFLDHMREAADAWRVRPDHLLPCAAVVGRAVEIRLHVAVSVTIVRHVRDRGIEATRLDPADPIALSHADVGREVGPVPAAVARKLDVAVIGSDPDLPRCSRTFRDRVDRRVHLGRRIVDRDSARLFLPLADRIVGRKVGRDSVPRHAMVSAAEQELRSDVDRALLVRRQSDRRVPVEAQLLLIARLAAGSAAPRASCG